MFQLDLQIMLERGGRCPQFYSDMVTLDANLLNIVSLALSILWLLFYLFKTFNALLIPNAKRGVKNLTCLEHHSSETNRPIMMIYLCLKADMIIISQNL